MSEEVEHPMFEDMLRDIGINYNVGSVILGKLRVQTVTLVVDVANSLELDVEVAAHKDELINTTQRNPEVTGDLKKGFTQEISNHKNVLESKISETQEVSDFKKGLESKMNDTKKRPARAEQGNRKA